jgi:nucleoid DNA-binding protein
MRIGVIRKTELVRKIANDSNITIPAARIALNVVFEILHKTVTQEKSFMIPNVGTLYGYTRPERKGRNPYINESIIIKEKKIARFRSHFKENPQ